MNKKHLYWIIPIVLIIGVMIGIGLTVKGTNYEDLQQFCLERGHKDFAKVERGTYEGEEVLRILCVTKEGLWSSTESINVYDERYNKPE